MAQKTLKQLYETHQGKLTDKWSIYLAEYDRIFASYRESSVRLLEIGIQNGGSLEIWTDYFRNAQKFVGCDIDPNCAKLSYTDPRISVIVGDANTDLVQTEIQFISQQFDIVIDDGSHFSSDIIKSFARYWPHIVDGGVFIAEDLHCSYWQVYEGGLYDPYSSLAFFKRLSDIINHEHWGLSKKRTDVLRGFFVKYGFDIEEVELLNIHSVEFVNSICVIRKCKPAENTLGVRIVSGADEGVTQNHKRFHLASKIDFDESLNPWANRKCPPDEELSSCLLELTQLKTDFEAATLQLANVKKKVQVVEQQLHEVHQQNHNAHQQLHATQAQLEDMHQRLLATYDSTSWQLTGPLRFVSRQIKRVPRVIQLAPTAIKLGGGLVPTAKKAVNLFMRDGIPGIKAGFRLATSRGVVAVIAPPALTASFGNNDYTEWVRQFDTRTEADRTNMRATQADFAHQPLISVLMPTYNPKADWLVEAIESVRNQIYPHWELCIADDASPDATIRPILERYASQDSRIKIVMRPENGHISAASNSALELVTGEWVALLDHDDILPEHALFWVAHTINAQPDVRLIYSDEDKIDETGRRFDPYFKSDWNPDLFYSHNMFCHLGVYETALMRSVGGFRVGFEGAQDYDLVLRCIEKIDPKQICHISRVLYHWRAHENSTAHGLDAKPYAMPMGVRALNEHFQRMDVSAKAKPIDAGYQISYQLPEGLPLVSIIIPTRNGLKLLSQCIDSVVNKTTYSNYEILVIDNGSDDAATLAYLQKFETYPNCSVIRDSRPFNYSALNNNAVKQAKGEIIALLNNDIEVISPDWLSEMVSHALRPGIGAVGAKLWYPNDKLQHGGVVLGIGGVAGHIFMRNTRNQWGYFSRAALAQNLSAVTAACLVIKKSIFEAVDGLNDEDLAIAFNDVDFCIRVREAGYRNVWTPFAELYHHESATRGYEDTPEKQARFSSEVIYMKKRWGALLQNDPAYSPNLTLDGDDFSLAWPPRTPALPSHANTGLYLPPTVPTDRVEKALHLLKRDGLGLEIGPSHNPMAPKKAGFNVHILDHATAEELKVKYIGHDINFDNIEEVDFVWQGQPLSELVGREHCYDWILASHLIEHTTDFVGFIQQCEKLLAKDGVLSLVVPDKRYCFDYFRWPSSAGEVLQAHIEGRVRHAPGTVFDHFVYASTMNKAITWNLNTRGDLKFTHTFEQAKSVWEASQTSPEYIDTHGWKFTPSSFRLLLLEMQSLGLTNLAEVGSFDTVGYEFWITLGHRQDNSVVYDRLDLCKKVMLEMEESIQCIK